MQYGLSLCLRRLGKSFGIYVRVCFCLHVRLQTERGRKRGPFGGGGLQPDPAAVPQRKVVPALHAGEGQSEEGGHLFPPDLWGHPQRSVQLLDLQVCRGDVFACVCTESRPVCQHPFKSQIHTLRVGSLFSRPLFALLPPSLNPRPTLTVCEQMIFNRAGRAARQALRPGSYK